MKEIIEIEIADGDVLHFHCLFCQSLQQQSIYETSISYKIINKQFFETIPTIRILRQAEFLSYTSPSIKQNVSRLSREE